MIEYEITWSGSGDRAGTCFALSSYSGPSPLACSVERRVKKSWHVAHTALTVSEQGARLRQQANVQRWKQRRIADPPTRSAVQDCLRRGFSIRATAQRFDVSMHVIRRLGERL